RPLARVLVGGERHGTKTVRRMASHTPTLHDRFDVGRPRHLAQAAMCNGMRFRSTNCYGNGRCASRTLHQSQKNVAHPRKSCVRETKVRMRFMITRLSAIIAFSCVSLIARSATAAIAIDVTTSRDGAGAATSITTPAFSTAAGDELLLAFVSTDYLGGTNAK